MKKKHLQRKILPLPSQWWGLFTLLQRSGISLTRLLALWPGNLPTSACVAHKWILAPGAPKPSERRCWHRPISSPQTTTWWWGRQLAGLTSLTQDGSGWVWVTHSPRVTKNLCFQNGLEEDKREGWSFSLCEECIPQASKDPSVKGNKMLPQGCCEAGVRWWDWTQFRYITQVLAVFSDGMEISPSSSWPSLSYSYTHSNIFRQNLLDGCLTRRVSTYLSLGYLKYFFNSQQTTYSHRSFIVLSIFFFKTWIICHFSKMRLCNKSGFLASLDKLDSSLHGSNSWLWADCCSQSGHLLYRGPRLDPEAASFQS